jgi:low affinity Fe/Cu permease
LEAPFGKRCASKRGRRATVILTLVFVCLVLWFFGLMTSYTLGGVLHILLVVAIVLFLVHLIQGRSIGNA